MEDKVSSAYGPRQTLQIEGIALDQVKPRRLLRFGQELALSGREVIIPDDLVAVLQQAIHEITTYETSTACDKITQSFTSALLIVHRSFILERAPRSLLSPISLGYGAISPI